ncbi:uncharacterized protein LOC143020103 [Oratosquilla oratoria]|uniref:uncharacterized protein LOC143020103 n=1 Tax=Oratosquilla oratoria TaxID=337810 RepID=UPI003F76EAC8
MKSAWIVLAVAFVLNESCSGVTARLALQRQKREFVIPPNLDEILEEKKDEIDPETRRVLSLLTKNVTEEEFFAELLALTPSQVPLPQTRLEDPISDDEDWWRSGSGSGSGSGEGPSERLLTPTTSFSGSPGFGPTEEALRSLLSPEILALILRGQDGGTPQVPEAIFQLLQMQDQEGSVPNANMLSLLLQQQQQIAKGQDGDIPDLNFLAFLMQQQQSGQDGPSPEMLSAILQQMSNGQDGDIPDLSFLAFLMQQQQSGQGGPSPEMLSAILQQHGQEVTQEGTPSPEFLDMILKLHLGGQSPNATIPFIPTPSGQQPSGEMQEGNATCDSHVRKVLESVLLCEETTRPIFEKCFNETGLAVKLPFISKPSDFIDVPPVQSVLKLLNEGMKNFHSDYENQISEFDLTVLEADIENGGSITDCMQQNLKDDIYADCNASSSFKCYMETCITRMA